MAFGRNKLIWCLSSSCAPRKVIKEQNSIKHKMDRLEKGWAGMDKTHGEVSLESGGWPTIFSKLGSPSAGQKLHSEAVSF
jgi:hypothetical protein